MRRRFEQGEILFRQGDPSDMAIQILSGSAEVLRRAGDDAIVLGTVHAGEFVGEMGVLEDRPRSATVRAAAPLEAELIERQAFLDRVIAEPELARKLLVRMSARLRDVEDMLTRIYTHGREEPAPTGSPRRSPAPSGIMLAAATKRAQGVIGGDPIAIDRLPFTVGRLPEEGEASPVIAPDLAIPEPSRTASRAPISAWSQRKTRSWCAISRARSAPSSTIARSGAISRSTARRCTRARTRSSPAAAARRSCLR